MNQEFNKLSDPFLSKADFNGGELPFLIETRNGKDLAHQGVKTISKIGNIFTAMATYDGLKKLDHDNEITRMEYSRPGVMI